MQGEAMAKETIRVLVIEDEPIAQRVLLQMLEKRGCTADLANNAKTALKMAEFSYHLIFLDYGLTKTTESDMDGIEVAKQIRHWEKSKEIRQRPIIMVSGFQEDEDTKMKWKEAGIDAYYTKPLSPNSLDEILQKYVIARLATSELVL